MNAGDTGDPGAGAVEERGSRIVVFGLVSGAFGVAGWVKIQSYTDPPGSLLNYPVWLLRTAHPTAEKWTEARWLQGRDVSGAVLAQLEGVATREQAAQLRGTEIGVRRSELPALRPGEFYWDDLIGLEACAIEGEPLGRIEEIRSMPAHPLLRIVDRSAEGKRRETLVPLVKERIKAVELAKGRIVLDWQRDW